MASLICGVAGSGKTHFLKYLLEGQRNVHVFVGDHASDWAPREVSEVGDNTLAQLDSLSHTTVVFDDCEQWIKNNSTGVSDLLMYGRLRGVQLYITAQALSSIPPACRENCATTIQLQPGWWKADQLTTQSMLEVSPEI